MTEAGAGDPQGKRALFEPARGTTAERVIKPTVAAGEAGKRSLFSAAERRPGTVVMHCAACGALSRVSWVEFGWRHVPFWLWIPGRSHSRLLRCPACERLAWQDVRFFG